jgi:hypothetical protein
MGNGTVRSPAVAAAQAADALPSTPVSAAGRTTSLPVHGYPFVSAATITLGN